MTLHKMPPYTGFFRPEESETIDAAVPGILERVDGFRALFRELYRMRLVMDATRKHENNLGTSIFHPVGTFISNALCRQEFPSPNMNWEGIDRDTAHTVARQFCEAQPQTDSAARLIPKVQIELRVRRAIMENETDLRSLVPNLAIQDQRIVGNEALLDAYLRLNADADTLLFLCMRDVIRRRIASFTEMTILMR